MKWFHLASAVLLVAIHVQFTSAEDAVPTLGYTQLRTNLPGGRHANVITMRAMVAGGATEAREVAPELAREPNAWTQFAGWSPDGSLAIVGRGWESVENGRWEEEHRTFRFEPKGWLYDAYVVDLASGKATNLTAIERVSFYNTGLFFWPGKPQQLGFQALIEGESHPFAMDRDGRHKRDVTGEIRGFAYGFNASPDGRRIAYHKDYQVYLADADGSHARKVDTGNPFNFAPQWSPNGKHLVFVSGEHYNCHPYVVSADGTGLRKLADRGGYRGVVEFLDVADFHGGSSDIPAWSVDSRCVYYTAKVNDAVELFRVPLDGPPEALSRSAPGTLHYHPTPSPDGRWLAYGSKRDGVRNLYVRRPSDGTELPITRLPRGHAALWAQWKPQPAR